MSRGLGDVYKRQPLQCEQPGPHGHPDVALPIHNRIPKKGCNGGKKQEKPLFLPAWDWQEATVTPHIVGKARVGEEGLVCQEIPVGFALETNAVTIFVVCSSTSRLLSLPGTKPVLERVKSSVAAEASIVFFTAGSVVPSIKQLYVFVISALLLLTSSCCRASLYILTHHDIAKIIILSIKNFIVNK